MDAVINTQYDVNNQVPALVATAPGKNNASTVSHSETGKARSGYPENRKDMDPATDAQDDIGGHNRVPLFKSFCRFTK